MNHKKKIQGVVISNKNDKTITIQVETYRKHPLYKKRMSMRHKFYAHDELNEAKVGDIVTIEECRPLSASKRFKLVSIDKKALESIKIAEEKVVQEMLHEDDSTKEAE